MNILPRSLLRHYFTHNDLKKFNHISQLTSSNGYLFWFKMKKQNLSVLTSIQKLSFKLP